MRLCEQFVIEEEAALLWRFLEQAELVASCMPGIELVEVLDPDNVKVRVTQSIGPMSATFDARVKVLERIDGESIHFEAIGKSVRGAVGSVRSKNSVTLKPLDAGTLVTVEGDVALAGALGSVGQKIVAKQAGRVTATFAANLQSLLRAPTEVPAPAVTAPASAASTEPWRFPTERVPTQAFAPSAATGGDGRMDFWPKASFVMSAISTVLSIVVLVRTRRAGR